MDKVQSAICGSFSRPRGRAFIEIDTGAGLDVLAEDDVTILEESWIGSPYKS